MRFSIGFEEARKAAEEVKAKQKAITNARRAEGKPEIKSRPLRFGRPIPPPGYSDIDGNPY